MVTTRRVTAAIKLELDDFYRSLGPLEQAGYVAVIKRTEATILQLIGLNNAPDVPIFEGEDSRYMRSRNVLAGDVFFKDDDAFFCMSFPNGASAASRRMPSTWAPGDPQHPFVEVGVISLRSQRQQFAYCVS